MQSLRELLTAPEPGLLVGVYDGVSSCIAEQAGASGLWVSGLCVSASKGLPDNEILTYESLLQRLEDVRRGSALPILADANAGFGDASVVRHLVRQLLARGIDGMSLEDKAFPRRNSFDDPSRIALEDEHRFAVKIAAAVEARGDSGFLIVARTDGFIQGEDLATVLSRATTYRAAGADAIIVHSSAATAREVLRFARAWGGRAPLIVIPTTFPSLSFAEAAQCGIGGIICANQLLRAAIPAMRRFVADLTAEDSISACDADLTPLGELLKMVDGFGADPEPAGHDHHTGADRDDGRTGTAGGGAIRVVAGHGAE